jgi:hypothetical protein
MIMDRCFDRREVAPKNPLPENDLVLKTLLDHVVNILDVDQISLEAIHILDQCAMASRSENETPETISEWSVFDIHGDGIGGRQLM